MTGEAHWMTLALLGVAALGVLLLFFFKSRLEHRFRSVFRSTQCPKSGEEVQLTAVQDARTSEWTGIAACSKFKVAAAITCDRACVAPHNIRRRLPAAPAPGR